MNQSVLVKRYLGVEIPEIALKQMAIIEAIRSVKEQEKIINNTYAPFDLKDLHDELKTLENVGQLRKDLTPQDEKELEDMLKFLENRKNRKLYETFQSSLLDTPKTLLMCPSSGFKGYMRELSKINLSLIDSNITKKPVMVGMPPDVQYKEKDLEKKDKEFIEDVARLEGLSVAEVKRQLEEMKQKKENKLN